MGGLGLVFQRKMLDYCRVVFYLLHARFFVCVHNLNAFNLHDVVVKLQIVATIVGQKEIMRVQLSIIVKSLRH